MSWKRKVQSINCEHGYTDLGPKGIVIFIVSHTHNEFYRDLPCPDFNQIKFHRLYHQSTFKKTSYFFELKNCKLR